MKHTANLKICFIFVFCFLAFSGNFIFAQEAAEEPVVEAEEPADLSDNPEDMETEKTDTDAAEEPADKTEEAEALEDNSKEAEETDTELEEEPADEEQDAVEEETAVEPTSSEQSSETEEDKAEEESERPDKTKGLWTKPDGEENEEAPAETAIAEDQRPTLLDTSLKFRIEASLAVDFLVPFDNYGTWETLLVSFYHTPIPNLTYFITVGGMLQRDKGVGFLGAGVYVDWTAFLSTLTEISTGLYADFYPVFTAHHEFNFHLLADPVLNLNLGITYIHAKNNINKTLIPQAGLTFAMKKWTAEYRLFVDIAFPGTYVGLSHLASVGYGEDGNYYCYVTLNGGKSSYLSDLGTQQTEVNNYYVGVKLGHRHWIKYNWGLFGEVRYLWLKDEYNLVGFMFGGFYAW